MGALPVRLGLIGLGRQGRRYLDRKNGDEHIVALMPSRHDVFGPIPAYFETWGRARVYTPSKMAEFLDSVEAVIIATPAATHAELAIRCLEAGKPVLVEKPLATTWQDCVRVIDLAERKGLPLLVGHTHIFSEAWATRPPPDVIGVFEARFTGPADGSARLEWSPHLVALAADALRSPFQKVSWTEENDGAYARMKCGTRSGAIVTLHCAVSKERMRRLEIFWRGFSDYGLWQYDTDAISDHTALWHQVEAFKRLCSGEADERASYSFTRATYSTLFGEKI
jgi:hypothetical protein